MSGYPRKHSSDRSSRSGAYDRPHGTGQSHKSGSRDDRSRTGWDSENRRGRWPDDRRDRGARGNGGNRNRDNGRRDRREWGNDDRSRPNRSHHEGGSWDGRWEGRDERRRHSDDGRRDQRGSQRRRGHGSNDERRRGIDRRGSADHRPRRNRGGEDKRSNRKGTSRPRFREERLNSRRNEPRIPEDIDWKELDPAVRQDLRSLSKDNAERVGGHMVAVVQCLADDDPQRALEHARAAKERGGRVAVVRETLGIAAYHAGEWKEALSELRAARRMSGGPGLVAVMADCERGLGRPEKAIEIAHDENLEGLTPDDRADVAIVVSGARRDMGEYDAAVLELERFGLEDIQSPLVAARVHYAYADALIDAGRSDEAREWFERSIAEDEDELLDGADRLAELTD